MEWKKGISNSVDNLAGVNTMEMQEDTSNSVNNLAGANQTEKKKLDKISMIRSKEFRARNQNEESRAKVATKKRVWRESKRLTIHKRSIVIQTKN